MHRIVFEEKRRPAGHLPIFPDKHGLCPGFVDGFSIINREPLTGGRPVDFLPPCTRTRRGHARDRGRAVRCSDTTFVHD
ncbi:hypothetical protein EVAR_49679_1 [Eumeta japonica]|uniref:Uncharacterized protein n=1 Tax=Eumeta variegata TaxID=151549 RepID=A0A4C1WSF0_EUMVA|nr:hypothetical protein EVAR_49679_1 [Eumeta japonica]